MTYGDDLEAADAMREQSSLRISRICRYNYDFVCVSVVDLMLWLLGDRHDISLCKRDISFC